MAATTYEVINSVLVSPNEIIRIAVCALAIYVTDRDFNVELQRGDGESGDFETIAIIRGHQFSVQNKSFIYVDTDLPTGTGLFRYRARHVRNDAIPSPYSTEVIALATLLDIDDGEIVFEEPIYDPEGSSINIDEYTPFGGDGTFI